MKSFLLKNIWTNILQIRFGRVLGFVLILMGFLKEDFAQTKYSNENHNILSCAEEVQKIKKLRYFSTNKAWQAADSFIIHQRKNNNVKCFTEGVLAKASMFDFQTYTRKSILYLFKSLQEPFLNNSAPEKASVHIALASYYLKINLLDSAYVNIVQAQKLLENNAFCESGKLNNIYAKYYYETNDYPKSLQYALKAKDISASCNDDATLAEIYSLITIIHRRQFDYEKSLYFQKLNLKQCEILDDKSCFAKAYYNYSVTMFKKNERKIAVEYAKKALELNLEINDKSKAVELLILIADIDFNNKTNIQNASRALSIATQAGLNTEKIRAQLILANIYVDASDEDLLANNIQPKTKWSKADALYSSVLTNHFSNLFFRSEAWLGLSKTYSANKDWINAYDSYKKYIVLRDSLMSDQTQKKVNRMEIEYEYNKKADSIKLQQALTNAELEKQSLIAQQQQQQLTIAEKEKRIQNLAFLRTQAELQTSQALKNENVKQLKLTANELQLKKNQLKTTIQEAELSNLRIRQMQLLGILFAMIIGVAAMLVIYYKNKREKEEMEKLRKQISQNLHDEIGANMSKIKLLSTMSKVSLKNEDKLQKYIQQIFDSSHQIGYSINDVIWSLNEDNMNYETILSRIRRYASEMYEAKTIEYTIQFENVENLSKKQILKLRQIYFIIKEAVNNTCKYSNASNAAVNITLQKNILLTTISDDGIGFERDKIKGNGINNIISRCAEINAECNIESILDKGTVIHIKTPF